MSHNRGKGAAIKWIRDHVNYDGEGCLKWPFYIAPFGYGQMGYNGKMLYAHRVMCEEAKGPAPSPDHEAAHNCGKGDQACVHPKHLDWKTKVENRRDSTRHGTGGRNRYGNKGALKPADIAQIWALKGTLRQTDIASKFGVSWQVISGIYCGRHYKQYAPPRF